MELLKTMTFWTQMLKYALALAVGFGVLPGVHVDVSDPAQAQNLELASRILAFIIGLWATDGLAKRRTALKLQTTLKDIATE